MLNRHARRVGIILIQRAGKSYGFLGKRLRISTGERFAKTLSSLKASNREAGIKRRAREGAQRAAENFHHESTKNPIERCLLNQVALFRVFDISW